MKKFVLSLVMILGITGAVFAQNDLQVLAVVKLGTSESITVKQVKNRCAMYEKQRGTKLTLEEKKKVLNALIEEKLVLHAAAKEGIAIPESTVDQYFLQNMAQAAGAPSITEKQLNDLLKSQQGKTLDQALQEQVGMTVTEYKLYLKNQLICQQYILKQKQSEIQGISATDDEIRAFYESNKSSFVWNDMLEVFLVIVPKGSNAEQAKTKCNDLLKKYKAKANTETEKAIVEQAKKEGFQAGALTLPKTEAAADTIGMPYKNLCFLFDQGNGYVSDLSETANDFRFIKVGKKYDAKLLSISDIVSPGTNVTVYEYIKVNLTGMKQQQYLAVAAAEVASGLNKPENVEQKKTGDALDKLLNW
ncbi:MAG: peptidyl-prolyl cis-trans isomerase [Treponema sp.]|nr:peptidyl-prolyl cis-trans isomerase [Treponema sp.]